MRHHVAVPVDDSFRIRTASAEDMPTVARVLGPDLADFYRRRLDCGGVVLASWRADELVGAIYVSWDPADEPVICAQLPGVPLLYRLLVREDLRKHGIATGLVRASETLLRSSGFTQIAVGVDPDNYQAIRLYDRLGYAESPLGEIATFQERYDDGELTTVPDRCLVYVKRL